MPYVSTRLQRELVVQSIVTVHYFEYPKDFVFLGETHDFWELLYVDRGSIEVTAGEETHVLNTNDVIFHEPEEFHAFRSAGGKPLNLVAVSFLCDSPLMNSLRRRRLTLSPEEQGLISEIIAEAGRCFSTPLDDPFVEQVRLKEGLLPGQSQLLLLYLELFLLTVYHRHCCRQPEDGAALVQSKKRFSSEELMERVLLYMERHIADKLTVSQICDSLSLSRTTLETLFHNQKRCGMMEYFNLLKIDKAKELLRDGAMNITELSYYLSYGSLQYFSRKFKEVTGMSPREYLSSVTGIAQTLKHSVPHFYTEHREV